MAVVSLQAESATIKPTEFERLERAWRYAKAQWELAENDPSHEGLDLDEGSEYCDAEHAAFCAMMLHPTANPRELARKLKAFRDEDAHRYTLAAQLIDRMVRDASLIAYGEEG